MRACHAPVRAATGDVFSDDEIEGLIDRMTERARRAKAAAPTATAREALAQAAGEMTRESLLASLTETRMRVAAEVARTARHAKLERMPSFMGGAEKLDAFNVGSERQGHGTSSSVDAEGRARQMALWGQVQLGLDQMPGLIDRMANPFGIGEKGFDRLIAREMERLTGKPGAQPTGDAGALHAAQVLVKALDEGVEQQNELGAWIQRIPGYIGRQSHDANKVAGSYWAEVGEIGRRAQAAGRLDKVIWTEAHLAAQDRAFGEWRDFITPRLDPKTFDGVALGDAQGRADARGLAARGAINSADDPRELFLHRVWTDIVSGRHAELTGADDHADYRAPPSLARSVSAARVLHFKDADAWMDYAGKYGRGGLLSTVVEQLGRAGRNAALMKHWGPNPEAAFEAEKARLANAARATGDPAGIRALGGTGTQANFESVTGRGEAPANLRLAQTMSTIRRFEALTKLGSIVLSKATDLPMTGLTFARAGAGFMAGHEAFFTGLLRLGSEDAKRAADALDVGARSFAGHLGGQYMATDGARGWTSWATRLMYRINGFEFLNDGVRKGAAEVYSRFLGQEAEHGWAGLQQGTRETFERFGIGETDWDMARAGLQAAPDGRTYFTLEHLDGKDRATADLRLKMAAMIHNTIDDTVSEPRAREHAKMTSGTKAGTLPGEIMRSFWQFKGFVNAMVGRHLVPAARGYAGYKPVGLMAYMIVGSALAGWVSMNAKLISRGQEPRGLVGADVPETLKIWGASLAQGGGLGLYGDFLFGEQNRNGADFDWGSLGGPLLSDSEQVAKVVMQAVHGGAINSTTGRSQIPGELVKLGSQNIPLINTWYTRMALDYLILWRLQEAVSPGYLQRYEQRVRSQGGAFLVAPTSAAR